MIATRGIVLMAAVLAAAPALAQQTASRTAAPLIPGGDSKAPISINADKLQYFDKEKKLVYSGNVQAKQGDATLRASSLVIFLADTSARTDSKPTASPVPSGGGQDVRRMEAAGPVTIIQKDQVGIGDNALYDKVENKVYLNGHVSLSQGPNITKGDRLIYDLSTSQAQIEGGRVESIFTPGGGDGGSSGGKPAKGSSQLKPSGKSK
ncbi:MAG TPA: LptA/OstA family protein [Beijerinckiaceae bacterium]|jgi:lipopolysaccharide export system protein LptA|nr:LptA/OstA family protein [Beijerinckiaceae bacterium]